MTNLIAASIEVTAVAAVVVLVVLRLSTESSEVVIFEKVSVVVLPELTPVCTFMNVQTGVNSGNTTTLTFSKMTTSELSVDSLSTTSTTTAATAVTSIDAAIKLVNVYQTYIGAMKNVMTFFIAPI